MIEVHMHLGWNSHMTKKTQGIIRAEIKLNKEGVKRWKDLDCYSNPSSNVTLTLINTSLVYHVILYPGLFLFEYLNDSKTLTIIAHHFQRIYGIYLNSIKNKPKDQDM